MGLSKGINPLAMVGKGRVLISGGFVTTASGNPSTLYGQGYSVARTNTGRYTVTLAETANAIEGIFCQGCPETPASAMIVVVDQDTIANPVFEIQIYTTAASQTSDFALADDAGSVVYFLVVARNTNVDY